LAPDPDVVRPPAAAVPPDGFPPEPTPAPPALPPVTVGSDVANAVDAVPDAGHFERRSVTLDDHDVRSVRVDECDGTIAEYPRSVTTL
jgi:hypothetical protein